MDKLLIRGGRRLNGEVTISGAKNAALPELCATLLVAGPVTLHNVPKLQDVATALKLIRNMGVAVQLGRRDRRRPPRRGGDRRQRRSTRPRRRTSSSRRCAPASWCWARCWPASARRRCRCRAAARSARGRSTSTSRACRRWAPTSASSTATSWPRPTRLKGARITTDMVTVTGTENLLMAATLAEGETILENAAQEPEIPDLAELLISMGARIEGHGTSRIRIQGVDRLHAPAQPHRIVPDRIEAGTFLCAVAAAGGDVILRNAEARHLEAVIEKLREAGVAIEARRRLHPRAVAGRRRAEGRELPHQRVPGVPDRHAGAVHGRRLHRRGHRDDRRDDLREPLHARQRTGAPGREDRGRRQAGGGQRRASSCRAPR